MTNDTVEQFEHKGYTVRIRQDVYLLDNPILEDEVVKVVVWHREYNFGSCQAFSTPQTFDKFCEAHNVLRLPIYLMDHSGLTVSTSPFHCSWDSGQVGWVFVTAEDAKENLGSNVNEVLRAHVQLLDDYLTGNCYGFEIIKRCTCCGQEDEVVESCWGFFGDIDRDDGVKAAAIEAADYVTPCDTSQRKNTYAI